MKFCILLFSCFFLKDFAQNRKKLIQEIDMNGNFVISFIDDTYYKKSLKDSVKSIIPFKNDEQIDLKKFQKEFPELYNGKCLKITDPNLLKVNLKICDQSKSKEIDEEGALLFGTFFISSYFDEFNIIKFNGFEASSNYIFNTKTKQMFAFGNEPIFSEDKKFVYGYSQDYFGFVINILQLDSGKSLRYKLHGKYDIINVKLTQLKSGIYQVVISLCQIERWNETTNVLEKISENLKLSIF